MDLRAHKAWTAEQIAEVVERLAHRLNDMYASSIDPVCVVPILKGSMFFAVDLIRAVNFPTEIYPLTVQSYGGKMSPGNMSIEGQVPSTIAHRRVLIVDDIYDTGATIEAVKRHVGIWKPSAVCTCVLLLKGGASRKQYFLNGFHSEPNRFYFGYGMDRREEDRSLEDIWSIPKDED